MRWLPACAVLTGMGCMPYPPIEGAAGIVQDQYGVPVVGATEGAGSPETDAALAASRGPQSKLTAERQS